LRDHESPNVTFVEPDGSWPVVWERAAGVRVWDADGRRYLDLTAAFGVAAAGHANPRVVRAGRRQMGRLLHAMGDVHPHALKAELARELSRLTFQRWTKSLPRPGTGKTVFCNSGFEAVETALKTAMLATGKPGVIVFEGAYHGLGYGTLNATHRDHFRGPFRAQLREFGFFLPFPKAGPAARARLKILESQIGNLFRRREIGAILVEPIQVRGGVNVPPPGFLSLLRRMCDGRNRLLILDEIYTGFGRTGRWFACEHERVVPDLVCLGKAMTGGFPLSACVGRAGLMDAAWPRSAGEAIHTSTFLGHPVGCAMALAQIRELARLRLVERAAKTGAHLLRSLSRLARHAGRSRNRARPSILCVPRGMGLLAGLELTHPDGSPAGVEAMHAVKKMLHAGFILLPEGAHGNVLSFTPPLTVPPAELDRAVAALETILAHNETL
jgi:4-aminobutyrate aminotransferase-like enzyme